MPRLNAKQREKILEKAIDVFGREGLKGATIRLVGKAAGFNSSLIYYYFEDKNTLFREAIQFVIGELLEKIKQKIHPFANGTERIECLVNAIYEYWKEVPERMRLMSIVLAKHPNLFAEVLSKVQKDQEPAPISIIKEGIEKGELVQAPPLNIWWLMIGGIIFNLRMLSIAKQVKFSAVMPPPFNVEENRKNIIKLLTQGMVLNTESKITNRKFNE